MTPIKTILFAGAAAVLTAGAASAQAQNYESAPTLGPYISAGYNYLDFDEKIGGDANVSGLTARGGWQFSRLFSVEGDITFGIDNGGFDFNADEDDLDFDDNDDSDFDDVITGPGDLGLDYLIGGYGRFTLPLNDRFNVFARAGYAFAEIDSTVTTVGGNELVFGGSDDGLAFGGGVSFSLTDSISIRTEYTHYDFSDANAESLGIHLQLNFGG